MKFRMAERSLFAILLRSPWWISLALAGVIALIARLALPAEMFWFGAMGGFPFLVIAVMAARRQMKEPSAARVQQTLEAAGAMSWRDFSAALEDGWLKQGFTVNRRHGRDAEGADFAIHKAGVTTLVSGKRWKAASLSAAAGGVVVGCGALAFSGGVVSGMRRCELLMRTCRKF